MKSKCGTPYGVLVPPSIRPVNVATKKTVTDRIQANLHRSLYDFAVETQLSNPTYTGKRIRRHVARHRQIYLREPFAKLYTLRPSYHAKIYLHHLDAMNPASWNALALFCLHGKASLLSILLAEAGFLSMVDMVLFQALCTAPLLPSTCWGHRRVCADMEFLHYYTGLRDGVITESLHHMVDVGVLGEKAVTSKKTINKGITIRPLQIILAAFSTLSDDDMDVRWAGETALLLNMHGKELHSMDFKLYLSSLGMSINDLP